MRPSERIHELLTYLDRNYRVCGDKIINWENNQEWGIDIINSLCKIF